ncbi:MAG: TonB-dependent receptor [Gemmatimonadaceae bacterium]|nr:TonB-dependent receptor [Gemmatimonadaceae bacterium]
MISNHARPLFPARRARLTGLLLAGLSGAATLAAAQGVAGAAIQGTVKNSAGTPLPEARLSLIDSSTGYRRYAVTSARGSFSFENLPVGGPYTLEARALGFLPESVPGIVLHLGDRLTRGVTLEVAVQRLTGIVVRDDASRDAGAGGPVHDVPGEAVRSLPLLKRDFVGLLAMAPQATGSPNISISGQHPRLNAIQVDGGSASDYLGLNTTPGANVGARALSLEALDELRILVAPFEVRQGGFSGGLINAVTRSGSNQFRGSTFVSFGRSDLVGADTAGARIDAFSTLQYGFSGGGPIIRDRLHFFVVADLQAQRSPAAGLRVDDPSVASTDSMAARIARIVRERYGFEPGGADTPVLNQPNATFFTKLSWQPSSRHLVELTTNFADARADGLARGISSLRRDGWQLSRSGSERRVHNVTTRVKATSSLGIVSNELIASLATSNTDVASVTRAPIFLIGADPARLPLSAGSTRNAQDIRTDQRIIELTDNVTWSRGDHLLTAGVQSQFLHIFDTFFLNSWGAWTFGSVDALEQGIAQRYERAIASPNRPEGPVADYSPHQLASYVEDRWSATQNLTLSAGMRVDAPFLGAPASNPVLLASVALGGSDTGRLPSGNAVISPRLGFAYDIGRERDWLLRGGMGGFAGHAPYVYVNSAYANTGQDQAILVCTGGDVPPPTGDIGRLPTRCLGTTGVSSAKPPVTLFAPDFRFQQAVKFDIGVEHVVGNGITASMDIIHTRTRNTPFLRDMNLAETGVNFEGRVMYGRIANRGAAFDVIPSRLDSAAFGPVYGFENRSMDRSTSVTVELQKKWAAGLFQVGYNWSRSDDVMSFSGNLGPNIMAANPIDGSMTARRLRRSARDIPHNLVVTAIVPTAFGISASAFLRARSGTPYAYQAAGDPNADGFANDLAFIPADSLGMSFSSSSSFAALNSFIEGEACLRDQRGQIMARNSCRNHHVTTLDMRFAKRLRVGKVKNVEVGVDVFNLPNLLRSDWGIVRETSSAEGVILLSVSGWDALANRPRYTVPSLLPSRDHVVTDASRWRMQLSARLDF